MLRLIKETSEAVKQGVQSHVIDHGLAGQLRSVIRKLEEKVIAAKPNI